jgi:hypothetical protein
MATINIPPTVSVVANAPVINRPIRVVSVSKRLSNISKRSPTCPKRLIISSSIKSMQSSRSSHRPFISSRISISKCPKLVGLSFQYQQHHFFRVNGLVIFKMSGFFTVFYGQKNHLKASNLLKALLDRLCGL